MTTAPTSSLDVPREALVTCAVCAMQVPLDEAVVPEVADRLVYFCGLDCYARWRGTAATAFPSVLC